MTPELLDPTQRALVVLWVGIRGVPAFFLI